MSYRYSQADADEILAAIPTLDSTQHREVILAIEAAVSGFATLAAKRKLTAKQVRTQLNTVRHRARMVLARRRYLTDNFVKSPLNEAAFRELQRAAGRPLSLDEVFALSQPALRRLAERAIARMDRAQPKPATEPTTEPATKPTMARHEGNKPLQRLIEELLGIWIDLHGRLPGTSPLHSHGGPFLRFATACLKPVSRDCPALLTTRQIQIDNLRARFRRSSVAGGKRLALKKST